MIRNVTSRLTAPLLGGALLITGLASGQTAAPAQSKAEIEQVVRQYILDHPEVLMESVRLFQAKQQAQAQEKAKQAIVTKAAELNGDPTSPALGAKDADAVTIVEFFDYRCGYCKSSVPTLAKLMADNPKVRVVYKEFPILGPDSMVASRAALAAHKQGAEAYKKMHHALMTATGSFTPEAVEKIAASAGLDVARLRADMSNPEIDTIIARNHELAGYLNVQSTPSFVVGGELMTGARDLEAFHAAIAKAGSEKVVQRTPEKAP